MALYAAAQKHNLKVLGIKDLSAAISKLTKVKLVKKESPSQKETEKIVSPPGKPVAEKKVKSSAVKKPREVSV